MRKIKMKKMEYVILALLFIVIVGSSIVTVGRTQSPFPQTYITGTNYQIMRVIDGDTVEFAAPFLPDPLPKKLSLRVLGIDTPEKGHRAKCSQEQNKAALARRFTERAIQEASAVIVRIVKWDKFGGRVLGDLEIDGDLLSAKLIRNGYAVPYFGQGEKEDWCKKK